MPQPTRDIFISHAHADKSEIVLPLRDALRERFVSTWIDQGHIAPAESILTAVNDGLAKATHVAVVITDTFLQHRWTQRELAAAYARAQGSIFLIVATPLEQFHATYPMLTGERVLIWDGDPAPVADELAEAFNRQPDKYHVLVHRREHVGPIWTRLGAVHSGRHSIELLWGVNVYSMERELQEGDPISLTHKKLNPDQVPLLVRTDPPALVAIGEGAAPDRKARDINEGWTRACGWDRLPSASEDAAPSPAPTGD